MAKKPIYKRWWFWVVVVILIGVIGNALEGPENENGLADVEINSSDVNNENEPESNPETNKAEETEDEYEITGDMEVEFTGDKVIVTVVSNAVDGAIFETIVMDNQINTVTGFISIKNGEGTKEFDIPDEWEVGYMAGSAMMRFNLDDHPQPEEVKELYGQHGENLIGDLAQENNLGGKNINILSEELPYPDKETVETKQKEMFTEAMAELISVSEGVIVDIEPLHPEEGWKFVKIIVSDAWYNSQEYEKERFAEQLGETAANIVINTGTVGKDERISVYFYDTHDKELASPKMLGGYKVKR